MVHSSGFMGSFLEDYLPVPKKISDFHFLLYGADYIIFEILRARLTTIS